VAAKKRSAQGWQRGLAPAPSHGDPAGDRGGRGCTCGGAACPQAPGGRPRPPGPRRAAGEPGGSAARSPGRDGGGAPAPVSVPLGPPPRPVACPTVRAPASRSAPRRSPSPPPAVRKGSQDPDRPRPTTRGGVSASAAGGLSRPPSWPAQNADAHPLLAAMRRTVSKRVWQDRGPHHSPQGVSLPSTIKAATAPR
jgi:hypothetical protein